MGGSSGFYDDACIWFGVSVRAGGAHRNIDSLLRMRHPAFFMVLSRLMDTLFCRKEEKKEVSNRLGVLGRATAGSFSGLDHVICIHQLGIEHFSVPMIPHSSINVPTVYISWGE